MSAEERAAPSIDAAALRIMRRALDVTPEARARFVREACGGDPRVEARVGALLASMDDAEEFLETPAMGSVTNGPGGLGPPDRMAAQRVGHYRILRQIGAGGMGVVYLAEQDNPRRTVALKMLRSALPSARARRLFEHEAQILGRLEHPNVARVFEASTHTEGPLGTPMPFFAMEHIAGAVPLTDYARRQRLDTSARIATFRKACLGVHHGHQKGIVHRDLKPANIVVDSTGEPRVIDYGVALLTGGDAGGSVAHSDGGNLVGTLRYMSPEQCRGDMRQVDTRSDVYALGVVLYELLCDRFPHDLDGLSPIEITRTIIERPPMRPRVAAPHLPHDLETILLKSMAKAPDDRYQSAADLERDLGRYLRHEPIEARPFSAIYNARLFMRRHRALFAASLFAGVAAVAAITISVGFGLSAREAERRAGAERDVALQRQYFADLAAAESALRANEFGRLRTHLASAPAALRGWEWMYLRERSEPSLRVIERPVIVDSVAVTADDRLMLGGGRNGVIGVWSLEDGRHLDDLRAGDGRILDLAISPTGDAVAATTADGGIALIDLESGATRWTSESRHGDGAHPGGSYSVSFSPDGSLVHSVGEDGSVRAHDIADGILIWSRVVLEHRSTLAGSSGRRALGISHHPSIDVLATGGEDGVIDLWESRTGTHLRSFTAHEEGQVMTLLFSRDGRHLYSGSTDRTIGVFDAETGELLRRLVGHQRSVWNMAMSADGTVLASASIDQTCRLWSTADGSLLGVRHGHGDAVADIAFARGDALLVTASWDRSLRVWNVGDDAAIIPPDGPSESIDRAVFSPDGRVLVTSHALQSSAADGRIIIRDGVTLEPLRVLDRPGHRPRPIALSPDGNAVASGWTDGLVTAHDMRTGELIWSRQAHDGGARAVAYSIDGSRVLTGGGESTVREWAAATGEPLRTFPGASETVGGIAISPDGTRMATTSFSGVAELWDMTSGSSIAVLRGHELAIYAATFTNDGQTLLTGSRDQSIRVWRARDGVPKRNVVGHGQWITGLAFTPDGSRLVATSWFETLTFWDAQRLEPIVALRGHNRPVRALAIDPAGERVVTGDDMGTIRVWDNRSRDVRSHRMADAHEIRRAAREEIRRRIALENPGEIARSVDADASIDRPTRHALLNALLAETAAMTH